MLIRVDLHGFVWIGGGFAHSLDSGLLCLSRIAVHYNHLYDHNDIYTLLRYLSGS